ncbi:Glutamate transport ATP-binding protein [Streptococcus mitis]|uniref:Glutamate transport ATP-binding protein n=1 Tax=Streptococcus mitis TaxID=28037 RepID=A0A150NGJ1_STRMT|nr:Glutamate transport ATP-binding protein [Streptococcus mitis]
MALVEFEHVEKYYGDYHALRDINLRFEKGQVVVLLGPSGSGKSTLIRTINGLEAVDKGSLLVNGHQVTGASQKDLVPLRKEVGMVFQHFNLYPHKTVLENVTLAPIKVLGIDKKEAEKTAQKYLEFVNMWDKKILIQPCYLVDKNNELPSLVVLPCILNSSSLMSQHLPLTLKLSATFWLLCKNWLTRV